MKVSTRTGPAGNKNPQYYTTNRAVVDTELNPIDITMNSDDLMSDPVHPMNHSSDSKGGVWNAKRLRDENEMYKNRLQDQKFSVGKQPFVVPTNPACKAFKCYLAIG